MSLIERVKNASQNNIEEENRSSANELDVLKEELYRHISSDEISQLLQQNIYRAKNEIKSICSQIFEGAHWNNSDTSQREELVAELLDAVFGLGPIETMLKDDSITEIMVNGSHSIFYERAGRLYKSDQIFSDDDQVRTLIDRIIGPLGRRIDEASPMVNARLKEGYRVNAIVPPLSLDGPILTVRKFRDHVYRLDELVEQNSIERSVAQFFKWAVTFRKNIAVSGGTGSGKTTLLNALSCEIPKAERIITIEDSAELKFAQHPHVVRLEARPRSAEGSGEVSIRDLVTNSLRMRPDRIIVGECRSGEALDMLQAMSTGHDGSMSTLHANSSRDAIMRLTTMVRYVADLPVNVIEAQIASALNFVIHTARTVKGHRYVQEIAELAYLQNEQKCVVHTLYRWEPAAPQGTWHYIPFWIQEIQTQNPEYAKEVEAWKQSLSLKS